MRTGKAAPQGNGMKKHEHIISQIMPDSIAEEMELEPGDRVVAVNGEEIEDIFDYQYLIEDEYVELTVEKASGEEWVLEIDKEEKEDLGIVFESSLMDNYRSCHNKCIFCFIDQMPPGMRETLYFKDDDSRLSFLQGNYVTLTNMSDHDIERIIRFHMSPINISVHTTNPELRCRMLNNRFAGEALKKIDRLMEGGITMNGQIVLCKGINDGEELERSLSDLTKYYPNMQSVSVVPVGLTRFREKLYPLEPFDKESAAQTIDIIEKWQRYMYERTGMHFVHASDEWYLLAGRDLPEEERYDGYLQLENGVGMIRLLLNECRSALDEIPADERKHEFSVASGRLAAPCIQMVADWVMEKFPNVTLHVYPIRNDFFGEKITVSGLITGQDLIAQGKQLPLGEALLLPVNMFRSGEEVFLDDLTRSDAEEALHVPIRIVGRTGYDMIRCMLNEEEEEDLDYPGYENKECLQDE